MSHDGAGSPAPSPLLAAIRRALAAASSQDRARQMQAYMKSAMPFAGVAMPIGKKIYREVYSTYPGGAPSRKPFADEARFLADVRAIWDGAEVREERYAALELFTHPRAKHLRAPSFVPLLRHVVRTGAWWDIVDWAAPKTLGPLLDTHPDETIPIVLAWAKDDDVWIRRSAILSQLHRRETDTTLLKKAIAPSLGQKEFFLAKAIGWALREHSKKDPAFVRAYVRENETKLVPLSVREATKILRAREG